MGRDGSQRLVSGTRGVNTVARLLSLPRQTMQSHRSKADRVQQAALQHPTTLKRVIREYHLILALVRNYKI